MSSTNKEATIMKMETPPSSPPPPEHNSVNNQHDDDNMETSPLPAVNNNALSSSPPTSTNFNPNSSLKVVPSSPIKNSSHPQSCAAPSTPLQSTTQSSFPTINHPSTPSTDTEGDGLFGLNIAGGRHHGDDLTPIIRNVSYVDSKSSSGGISSGGVGGGSRGVLRQRRLPLPRGSGGLKPSSSSGLSSKAALRSSTGFFPATSPSVLGGGSGSSGMLASVPSPPPSETEDEGFLLSKNNHNNNNKSSSSLERKSPSLSLSTEDDSSPSSLAILPGMYSDDESSIESSSNRGNNKRGGVASIVRHVKKKSKEEDTNGRGLFLAPIELKPDRKFFSFQGTSQYMSQVGGGGVDTTARGGRPTPPSLATIHSPPHRPLGEMGEYYSSPITTGGGGGSPKQYEPWARSQHGVTEMADTKELDAIFKSPRITRSPTAAGANDSDGSAITTSLLHHTVVTPAKQEQEEEASPPTTTMITNLPPNQDPEFLQPFPLDDRQYSIPSIRLANAVHRSDSLASYEMYSRTFSDEDESTWEGSFYAGDEDDDVDTEASWSTSGSISSLRRRQFLRHLSSASSGGGGMMTSSSLEGLRHLNSSEGGGQQRMMSGSLEGMRHLNSSEGQQTNSSSSIPAIAPSNSFMERMQGITINQRSNTFESSSDAESYQGGGGPPVVLNVQSSHPALMINATQSMDDAEYETRQDHRVRRSNHHSHRSARRRRSSHNRTSSAVEWIQGLQNPSNGGGVQIVEAASSKFLIGGTDGAGAEEAVATSEDVSKALGMPHPLCRSSTIEAGPFVNRAAAATTAATNGLNGIGE
eukprot:CAMPEP_0113388728 /NCGR_PEP_ID=MMETSP0013_2-20120614/9235_1 /TAXON_ID=2843 ORGANISM="Skeletonema costatum, Strain 1716" /NCGR_SAMPLE_ID=MMETSP0013_2 /ASSEMBLY_ACC=CAM_ASM_000158 /LENGTH=808 /DNA_ID=CAMNT_0000271731 /DNA_START=187 /DNA_END=2613 /DNA_ORIENTATION=+ /assembly_acc=CAM_ASM_000158